MSELLRAVLDESCSFSQPCFYTIDFTVVPNFSVDQATVVTNQDRYFLMTAVTLTWVAPTPTTSARWASATLFDALTSESIVSTQPATLTPQDQTSYTLLNWNLNNQYTLPEYKLWRPGSRIGGRVTTGNNIPRDYTFVLSGIEYGE